MKHGQYLFYMILVSAAIAIAVTLSLGRFGLEAWEVWVFGSWCFWMFPLIICTCEAERVDGDVRDLRKGELKKRQGDVV